MGPFWGLLGCYVVVLLLVGTIFIVVLLALAATALALGGPQGMSQILRPDVSSLSRYFSPLHTVIVVVGALASAVWWPVLLMPPIDLYRQIAGSTVAPPSEV